MLLDEEVFAVILAVSIIASALGIALTLKPGNPEPFTAIGLLNEECKIGEYPEVVVNNSFIKLCIYLANYLGKPGYFRVVYRIALNETLPSNTTSSPENMVKEWRIMLGDGENKTFPINVPVYSLRGETRVALVFELWVYDGSANTWTYTGRWNHLYVNITV
ncbi:MAG: DUF1616 domain-containing protein [Thermosphaera sp.]|nr:DUF1616 domain-containing protein [Thermosphaera sp.]